jgi:hypothetical protein
MFQGLNRPVTLIACIVAFSASCYAQSSSPSPASPPQVQNNANVVVSSGVATTGRVADPNERIVLNGYVVRMADFVAQVSSNTEAVQRLHTPETHSHEQVGPIPPSHPDH